MTNIDNKLLSPTINYQFYITSASPVMAHDEQGQCGLICTMANGILRQMLIWSDADAEPRCGQTC